MIKLVFAPFFALAPMTPFYTLKTSSNSSSRNFADVLVFLMSLYWGVIIWVCAQSPVTDALIAPFTCWRRLSSSIDTRSSRYLLGVRYCSRWQTSHSPTQEGGLYTAYTCPHDQCNLMCQSLRHRGGNGRKQQQWQLTDLTAILGRPRFPLDAHSPTGAHGCPSPGIP